MECPYREKSLGIVPFVMYLWLKRGAPLLTRKLDGRWFFSLPTEAWVLASWSLPTSLSSAGSQGFRVPVRLPCFSRLTV